MPYRDTVAGLNANNRVYHCLFMKLSFMDTYVGAGNKKSCGHMAYNALVSLKSNTMQFETPGGNHYCLMANEVQN